MRSRRRPLVREVVDVAGGGRAVAAAGPCAVLVAQMTARRIWPGIESEYPISSGRLGVLYGGSRRPVRSAEARPPGPDTKSTASRAIAYRCACRALR